MRLKRPAHDRPVGAGVLALLSVLVGLLALLGALSFLLTADFESSSASDALRPAAMAALGIAFLAMARGLWGMRRWIRSLCIALLPATVVAAVLGTSRGGVLDLASAMVFFAAFLADVAILGWLRIPATRALLDNSIRPSRGV